jgi:hypothetical protein
MMEIESEREKNRLRWNRRAVPLIAEPEGRPRSPPWALFPSPSCAAVLLAPASAGSLIREITFLWKFFFTGPSAEASRSSLCARPLADDGVAATTVLRNDLAFLAPLSDVVIGNGQVVHHHPQPKLQPHRHDTTSQIVGIVAARSVTGMGGGEVHTPTFGALSTGTGRTGD